MGSLSSDDSGCEAGSDSEQQQQQQRRFQQPSSSLDRRKDSFTSVGEELEEEEDDNDSPVEEVVELRTVKQRARTLMERVGYFSQCREIPDIYFFILIPVEWLFLFVLFSTLLLRPPPQQQRGLLLLLLPYPHPPLRPEEEGAGEDFNRSILASRRIRSAVGEQVRHIIVFHIIVSYNLIVKCDWRTGAKRTLD